jgi:hypothetical protein
MRKKLVRYIDADSFFYTAPGMILAGTPVFTPTWQLQGIHHTSTTNPNRPHLASRIDSIISHLNLVRKQLIHRDLELLLADFAQPETK